MKQKNTNKNINVGNTFNGPTQMNNSVIINSPHKDLVEEPATYRPRIMRKNLENFKVVTGYDC